MALVVADRVQETTTTSGTGTLSLAGAVAGYRSFVSGIGSGNTTYYTIYDQTAQVWEVGIGTVTSGAPNTLSRTTVLSNSSGTTSPLTLAGNAASVFCSYPASKSVNLDASGNVTPLGTIASGTWQGSTVGVAYGGTGVTSSSGANSVVLRDANQNIAVNRINQSNTNTTAAGGTTALTAASSYSQTLTGTGNQTYTMPDATTLTTGVAFIFNNNATGTITLQDYAAGAIGSVASGGAVELVLLANGTVGGTWDVHAYIPENVAWGTNSLALGSTVITGGTWNGGTIQPGYGGTGLTTFSAANYALYSSSASALTAGTLPIAAGGTGQTSFTANQVVYGSAFSQSANLTFDGTTLTANALSTTTGNVNLGSSITTGTITLGATAQTGDITIGPSTGTQTINIGTGVTTAGNIKTINIGTGGVPGSFVFNAINYGTGGSGYGTTHTFYCNAGNLTIDNSGIAANTYFAVGKTPSIFGRLEIAAGSAGTIAPLLFNSGTLFGGYSSGLAGAIEYNGVRFFATTDSSSGLGYIPTKQIFRLSANGSSIGSGNFFGTTSSINLAAGGSYEIEAYCYFTKTTASTVTVTLTTSQTVVNLNGTVDYGAITGGTATGAANRISLFAAAGTANAFGASGSLTTAVNHAFIIRAVLDANASNASTLAISFTAASGSITPLRNSYYKVTRLPSSNTGIYS